MHPLLNAQLADHRHAAALEASYRHARLRPRDQEPAALRTIVGTVLVRAGVRVAGSSTIDRLAAERASDRVEVCAAA